MPIIGRITVLDEISEPAQATDMDQTASALLGEPISTGAVAVNVPVLEFLYFESLTMEVSATWEQTPVRGRAEPYHFYANTTARTWSFHLEFHAGYDQSDDIDSINVLNQVRFFERLQYPILSGGLLKPPPRVMMQVGRIIPDVTGLIKNVRIQWGAPFDDDFDTNRRNGATHHATVDFVFVEVRDTPLSFTSPFWSNEKLPGSG